MHLAFITLGWAIGHWIGGTGNSLSALNFFFESSTMGTGGKVEVAAAAR